MHDQGRTHRQHDRGGRPVPGADRRSRPPVEQVGGLDRRGDHGVHVPALRAGRDRRLSPAAHAPGVQDVQAGRVRLGDRRLDGPAGRRARLGRRPPQAPRPHRPGGRPALPARRPRRGHPRPLARAHRLAVRDPRPGGLEEVRPRALRGPRHAPDQQALPALGALQPARPDAARLRPARLHARRARSRASSGAAWSARSSSTTSRGRSTPSATTSATGGSRSTTSPPTSSGSPCRRSARRGTTTTTRSRAPRSTACAGGRSTSRRWSSPGWRRSGSRGTWSASRPSARRPRRPSARSRSRSELPGRGARLAPRRQLAHDRRGERPDDHAGRAAAARAPRSATGAVAGGWAAGWRWGSSRISSVGCDGGRRSGIPVVVRAPSRVARALHQGDPATGPPTLRHPAQSDAAMTSRASGAAVAPPWPAPTSMTATAISGSAAS